MSTKNWLRFIALGALWGSVFLWIKIAQQELGTLTIVAFRVTFAVIGFVIIFIALKRKLPLRQHWKTFLILAVFNIILPFSLISWSQQYISSGISSILNSTSTLMTLLLAHWFVPDDRLNSAKGIGMILGFGGVVVLMSNQLNSGQEQSLLGQAAMLTAALSYSTGTIYARRKAHHIASEMIAMGQAVFGALVMVPLAMSVESPLQIPRMPLTWLATGLARHPVHLHLTHALFLAAQGNWPHAHPNGDLCDRILCHITGCPLPGRKPKLAIFCRRRIDHFWYPYR